MVELTCFVLGLTAGYMKGLIPQALSNRGQQPQLQMMKFKPLHGMLNAHTNITFDFFLQVHLKTKHTHILMDKRTHTFTRKQKNKEREKHRPGSSITGLAGRKI